MQFMQRCTNPKLVERIVLMRPLRRKGGILWPVQENPLNWTRLTSLTLPRPPRSDDEHSWLRTLPCLTHLRVCLNLKDMRSTYLSRLLQTLLLLPVLNHLEFDMSFAGWSLGRNTDTPLLLLLAKLSSFSAPKIDARTAMFRELKLPQLSWLRWNFWDQEYLSEFHLANPQFEVAYFECRVTDSFTFSTVSTGLDANAHLVATDGPVPEWIAQNLRLATAYDEEDIRQVLSEFSVVIFVPLVNWGKHWNGTCPPGSWGLCSKNFDMLLTLLSNKP